MIDTQPPLLQPQHQETTSKRRSMGRIIGGGLVILVGIGWLLDLTTDISIGWQLLVPLALMLVGLGIMAGAQNQNVSGLIGVGVVLTILTVMISTVGSAGPWAGTGRTVERPQVLADVVDNYDHGAGDYTLDLSKVTFTTDRVINIDLGVGASRIIVPENATVIVHAETGIGELTVFGERAEGVGLSMDRTIGDGEPTIEINADLGIGELEIRR